MNSGNLRSQYIYYSFGFAIATYLVNRVRYSHKKKEKEKESVASRSVQEVELGFPSKDQIPMAPHKRYLLVLFHRLVASYYKS